MYVLSRFMVDKQAHVLYLLQINKETRVHYIFEDIGEFFRTHY